MTKFGKINLYAVAISDREDFVFEPNDLLMYRLPTMAECRKNAENLVDRIRQGEKNWGIDQLFVRCIKNERNAKVMAVELIRNDGQTELEQRMKEITEKINQKMKGRFDQCHY